MCKMFFYFYLLNHKEESGEFHIFYLQIKFLEMPKKNKKKNKK